MSEAEFIEWLKSFIGAMSFIWLSAFIFGVIDEWSRGTPRTQTEKAKASSNVVSNVTGSNNVSVIGSGNVVNVSDRDVLSLSEAREILSLPALEPSEGGVDIDWYVLDETWFYTDNVVYYSTRLSVPESYGTAERR